MRQAVLDYISTINLGGFSLSNELPWDESDKPLFLRNPKRIYVDITNFRTEPLIQTMDGRNIDTDVAEVVVRFANDAKQLSPNYEELVRDLKAGKNSIEVIGNYRREVDVDTSFEFDLLVTEISYRFIKII